MFDVVQAGAFFNFEATLAKFGVCKGDSHRIRDGYDDILQKRLGIDSQKHILKSWTFIANVCFSLAECALIELSHRALLARRCAELSCAVKDEWRNDERVRGELSRTGNGGDVVSNHFSWSTMRLSLKRFVFI